MVPLVTTGIFLKIWEIGEIETILTMLTTTSRKAQLKNKALFVIKILMSLVPLPQYKL